MNRDVIERLATDRAMGGLSPDVEQLFDAYAMLDVSSAKVFEDVSGTVSLARRAVAERVPSSMPAFPIDGMMQIERWRRRLQRVAYVAGMAACLAIGASLGRLSAATSSGPQAVPSRSYVEVPSRSHVTVPQPRIVEPEQTDSGFWSVERIREEREAARARGFERSDVAPQDILQRWLPTEMQG